MLAFAGQATVSYSVLLGKRTTGLTQVPLTVVKNIFKQQNYFFKLILWDIVYVT